jgi:hypothetical protein
MSASLRSEHWAIAATAQRRADARDRFAALSHAADAPTQADDPPGYFFAPGRGRSLRLNDGIRRGRQPADDSLAAAQPEKQQRGVKHHHVLWSAEAPWGSVPYQTAAEAIHDVRATPSYRAGLGEKGYSRLQQKQPVALNEMRKFLAGMGLHRYAEKLQRRYGIVTPEQLLEIRRPQLESPAIGMTRPEILVFERAVKELARDYIARNSSATVARRVWGSPRSKPRSGGSPAILTGESHAPTAAAAVAAAPASAPAESFAEVMAEFEERHEFLQRMRVLGQSGVHEAAMRREMTQHLHRMEEIDRAKSMAMLWKDAKSAQASSTAGTVDTANAQPKPQRTGSSNERMAAEVLAAAESVAVENYIQRYPGA